MVTNFCCPLAGADVLFRLFAEVSQPQRRKHIHTHTYIYTCIYMYGYNIRVVFLQVRMCLVDCSPKCRSRSGEST